MKYEGYLLDIRSPMDLQQSPPRTTFLQYTFSILKSVLVPSHLQHLLWTEISEANNGVAKSDGGDVGRTWLQLMCCTLPKCLCP